MVRLINFAFRQTFIAIRFATPWVIRFLIFSLGVSVRLSAVALITVFKGVDSVATGIAEDWKQRAINGGFPTIWEIQLSRVFHVLAVCTIFAGWATLFFITVFTAYIAYGFTF